MTTKRRNAKKATKKPAPKVKKVTEEKVEPSEKCEAGCDPVLHPVVGRDSEGVPLCLRCYVELHKQAVSQSKSGLSSKEAKKDEATIPPAMKEKLRELVDDIVSDLHVPDLTEGGVIVGGDNDSMNLLAFKTNNPSSLKLASALENARAMTQASDEELMTAIIRNLSRIDPVDLSVQIIDQRDAVLGELRSKLYGDKKLG